MQIDLKKFFFITLILLIVFEIVFLTNFKQKKTLIEVLPNEKFIDLSISESVVSPLSFRYLASLNKGALVNSILTNTYYGRIKKIYDAPSSYFAFGYERALSISEKNGLSAVLIGKDALDTIEVKDRNGRDMNFNDLVTGEDVWITEKIDLSQPNPHKGQKISVTVK